MEAELDDRYLAAARRFGRCWALLLGESLQ